MLTKTTNPVNDDLRDLAQEERPDLAELARLHLFKGVEMESLEGLLKACRVWRFVKDEVIVAAGRHNPFIYLVLSGRLSLRDTRKGECLLAIGVGESVGEIAILDHRPSPHFVVAEQESRVLALDEESILTLVNTSHAAACNFLLLLTQRLRNARPATEATKRLQLQYRRLSMIDATTGLNNRRWLHEMLGRQITRSSMSNEALSLVLLRIDNMTGIRDHFGHEMRDNAACAIADALTAHVRPTDLLARYTVEKFAIALPDTDAKGARSVGEHLRTQIENAVRDLGQAGLQIQVSLGIAELKSFISAETLLAEATAVIGRAHRNRAKRLIGRMQPR